MEPAIEVKDLVVERGRRRVLHGINFTVPPGSVTGLLGPSGSGKTTLMRAIVGCADRQVGRRDRAGRTSRLGAAAPHGRLPHPGAKRVCRPHRPGERPVLRVTVRLRRRRRGPRDRRRRPGRAAGQLVGTLSGGQRSRASLACAILGQPRLLVLDEPTVGQDPVLRSDLWEQFHALAAAGTTVLVSSHVMDEASRCDRLLLIREGHLIADDTPAAVTRRRRHRRPRRGVPALIRRETEAAVPMNRARILVRHHRADPAPAAARPAHHRDAHRRAGRCC